MKTLYTTLALASFALISAQVTIEKTAPAPANSSVSLELGDASGGKKGIVLPWVTSAASVASPVAGTLIFDTTDQKIKFGKASQPEATAVTTWVDLTTGAFAPAAPFTADANAELPKARVSIGKTADAAPGILVLTDTNKAMVLPRVNAYTDIVNPSAGMMVYTTSNNQVAVFNGREWSFWKP